MEKFVVAIISVAFAGGIMYSFRVISEVIDNLISRFQYTNIKLTSKEQKELNQALKTQNSVEQFIIRLGAQHGYSTKGWSYNKANKVLRVR